MKDLMPNMIWWTITFIPRTVWWGWKIALKIVLDKFKNLN